MCAEISIILLRPTLPTKQCRRGDKASLRMPSSGIIWGTHARTHFSSDFDRYFDFCTFLVTKIGSTEQNS